MSVKTNTMVTEERNVKTEDIDKMTIEEIIAIINEEDKKVAYAVEKVLPEIGRAIEMTVEALKKGGRLIIMGAGTSGRLGVLDASECPPTFNTDPDLVKGIIAGGDIALRKAVEGAEDSEPMGVEDLKKEKLSQSDILIGLTASGRTPYVIGGLKYAREIGAKSVAISCNPNSKVTKFANIGIEAVVGPEVLTGSTRLKAGTAQKMILNMISTTTMIKLGKTYKNLMVDLQATNSKLKERALTIFIELTDMSKETSIKYLEEADWDLKKAILMTERNTSI